MKKFFVERPLARFARLSFSLPIITLILLVVYVQISQDIWYSFNNGRLHHAKGVLSSLISLPVFLQLFGITGLIFYGSIINDNVLTQVGIENVALLVLGSVLTTLVFFFICLSDYLSPRSHDLLPGAAKLQLISTSILIAIRYAFWKARQHTTKG